MATGLIGKTRLRLKALAEGVGGGGLTLNAARVKLGYDRTAESADFFAELAAAGPYLIIGTGTLDFPTQPAFGPVRVPALLYIGFDRDADDDFTAVDDLLEALRDAWRDPTGYGLGEAAPQHLTWGEWRIDPRPTPGLLIVPLRVTFPDPPRRAALKNRPAAEETAAHLKTTLAADGSSTSKKPGGRKRASPAQRLRKKVSHLFLPAWRREAAAFARRGLTGG